MKYKWIDYTNEYAPIVESWLDASARRYTGCDDGFERYFEYWRNESNTKIGENFWGKVICYQNIPFAVVALSMCEGEVTISEYIVNPQKRGQGFGSSALIELLTFSAEIIGYEIASAQAVIYPSNIASLKAFEKAAFVFDHAHRDGDAWYYSYKKI